MKLWEKFKPIAEELELEHGPFLVFALFLREDPFRIWDVVASATWLNGGERRSIGIITAKMQPRFTDSEIIHISRVVILDANDPATDYLRETFPLTSDKPLEVGSEPLSSDFGFDIKCGFFLRCQKKETEFEQIAL